MAELRESLLGERWVILSAARGDRPDDFKAASHSTAGGRNASNCPFCRGHEHETGEETLAFREGHNPSLQDWTLRVVRNKFPAVTSSPPMSVKDWMHQLVASNASGSHEVVVETPQHGVQFCELPPSQVEQVLKAFRHRLKLLKEDQHIKYVQVFKNNGYEAGASLRHSHSQIIALPVIPQATQQQLRQSKQHYEQTGSCRTCQALEQDMVAASRIIDQSSYFLALAPFAPRFPFETWIVPIGHSSNYEDITDPELQDLAQLLHATLNKLVKQLGDVPYNYFLHTSPVNQEHSCSDYFHWYVCILPRLVTMGGFEFATGCNINSMSPEKAAQVLRDCKL